MAENTPFHGSDLKKLKNFTEFLRKNHGFGSNVNPLGLSPRLKEYLAPRLDVLSSYPDREYTELREAMAAYTSADAKHVLCGTVPRN